MTFELKPNRLVAKNHLKRDSAFLSIIFAMLCLLLPKISLAGSNYYGGEVYYQHLHGSFYKVYLVYYTNCSGSTMLPLIGVTDGKTTKTYADTQCCTSNYDLGFSTGQCTVCSNSSCSFGFGVEFITSYATIDMNDFSGCNLTVYFASCCSNSKITTGVYDDSIYVGSILNRCNGDHNSPKFQEEGLFLMNVYKPVDIYQTASPANLSDSIVYKLIPPLKNAKHPLSFTPGYDYTFPMTYYGISPTSPKPEGFHYDQNSGELYFIPQQKDMSLMAIEADEYTKNASGIWYLAGSTTRTTTLTCAVTNSNNNLPQIAPISGTTNDTLYTCAGINIALQFKTTDPGNSHDAMTLLNVLNEPNGNLSYSTAVQQSATFYWTPANKDIRAAPYKVIMMADDGLYPMSDYSQAALYIFVKDSSRIFSIKHSDLGCGKYSFAINRSLPKGATIKWLADGKLISEADTPTYTFPFNGKHVVQLEVINSYGCVSYSYDTLSITILPNTQAFGGKKICQGSGTSLTAQGGLQYSWYPVSGLKSDTGSSITAYPLTSTMYYVSGTDANGCKAIDSVQVVLDSFKINLNRDTTECFGQMAYIEGNVYKGTSYGWTNSTGTLMSDSSSMYFKLLSDTQYIFTASDSFGCTKSAHGIIHAEQVKPKVAAPAVSVCFGDSVQISASSGANYYWPPVPGLLSGSLKSNPYVRPAHNEEFYVSISDNYGCPSVVDSVQTIVSVINQRSTVVYTICEGDSVHLFASAGKSFSWFPAYNISNAMSPYPYMHPDTSTTYTVTVCDTLCGCKKIDTSKVKVFPRPKISAGTNREICSGHSTIIGATGNPGYQYNWYSSPTGFQSFDAKDTITPASSATYYLRAVNPITGCTVEDTVTIKVDILNSSFTGPQNVCKGDTQGYTISSYDKANTYTWKVAGGHVFTIFKDNIVIIWDSSQNSSLSLKEELPLKCEDSTTVNINISLRPSAQIAVNNKICLGSPAPFVDLSPSGNSFHWLFGNGDTSDIKNPTYTYTAPGIYHVSLFSISGACSAFDSTNVQVFSPPARTPAIKHTGLRKYLFDNKDSTGIIYKWSTGDGDTLKFSSIPHTYTDTGVYKVVFDYSYPWGCPAIFDTTLNVSNSAIALPESYESENVFVFPNPFKDNLSISFNHGKEEAIQITILDAVGQVIAHKSFNNQPPGNYVYTCQSLQVPEGVYFLKYSEGENIKILKIIKL